ncbi:MAG: histidine--tRNA ligase [Proteobacteria bacterium]|nr:histidine--tRNA ligase [Pseudomonadota bacterium]
MAALQPVRGTRDLLPEECLRHRHVRESAQRVAALYGYQEIATPIFEFSEVFVRTLGDTSDIVTKEMYTFTDRGGESVTLRPEGTAGVARAAISEGLVHALPVKLFYAGPMFRYERPQKGRMRQFHQVGVELLGVAEPLADVEVVAMAAQVLEALGVLAHITLELNTLGDGESRRAYREALVAYLGRYRDDLSEESRARLDRNPLRILDSKDEGDRRIVAGAPPIDRFLTPAAAGFFAAVCAGLATAGVAHRVSPRLVRGLDYYCHTAFEFTTQALGAQGTVLAGGRYDGLIEAMGGPAVPGVGWAMGIDRLAMLVGEPPAPDRPVAVIPIGTAAEVEALRLAQGLRRDGLPVDLGYRGSLKRRLARADKVNARAAVLLGEDELKRGIATVRDLDSGAQAQVPLAEVEAHLRRLVQGGP